MKTSVMRRFAIRVFLYVFWMTVAVTSAGAEKILSRTANEGFAEQEFRRGVQAYYRGSFNEAILEFEKSLSYLPGQNLIMDWLGRAYYSSGMEGAALQQWQYAVNAGYGGLLLQNRIDIVRERRVTGVADTEQRFTEAGTFSGIHDGNLVFSQPISVLPNADGTSWVLAYGSNELLKFDVNGTVINRITGPVNGFDRPIDVLQLQDGNLLISESAGDRLTVINQLGLFQKYIGSKGRDVGQVIGPQYLAQNSVGNIYVSDFGNTRIDVFDKDGKGLFYFGEKNDDFPGLQGPTGIAIEGETVYVADCVSGSIYEFDFSGNYLGQLVQDKTFTHPESVKPWKNRLLVCDGNRVVSVDAETGALYENVRTGNAPSRLTCAVPDVNGNILVTDISTNEVYVMAKISELVGGFFVQIERVRSDNFPNVTVELKVENRRRQPIVGLKPENFLLTEDKRPVAEQHFDGAASNNTTADITILVDRSVASARYAGAMQNAVREIGAAMEGKGTLRIVSAGRIPVSEYVGTPNGVVGFTQQSLSAAPSDICSLDTAIRLAANQLIDGEEKRSIIYITEGSVTQNAFTKYSLSDISAYLNNNSIGFSVILLTQKAPSEEIEYICKNTESDSYYVYRPEGLAPVVHTVISALSGEYQLSYVSSLPTDLGRKFLPIEAEVYLLNRSGRDESGYYAPLQ